MQALTPEITVTAPFINRAAGNSIAGQDVTIGGIYCGPVVPERDGNPTMSHVNQAVDNYSREVGGMDASAIIELRSAVLAHCRQASVAARAAA